MIQQNIKGIKNEIRDTLKKVGKSGDEIIIVASSKTFPKEKILEAQKAGITCIGENYVQEAEEKFKEINIEKHLIGHLQTNKVKKALKIFDVIQTVDSLKLAEKIDKEARKLNKTIPVFIEVNIAKEITKFGIMPEETLEFIEKFKKLENIKVIGLMTMSPKSYFKKAKELFDKTGLKYLSMGMSNDYLEAIKEGSNMIRLGTAIFGERN